MGAPRDSADLARTVATGVCLKYLAIVGDQVGRQVCLGAPITLVEEAHPLASIGGARLINPVVYGSW